MAEAAAASPTLYERLWGIGLPSLFAIARREVGAYFVSPVGYVTGAITAVIVAQAGYLNYLNAGSPVGMDSVYALTAFWMVFGVPLITMRMLAEERRSGTLELLLTSPVRDWEVVIGKWLGSLVFFVLITAFVFVIAALLVVYQPTHQVISVAGIPVSVGNLDLGPIFTGYLGLLLAGAAYLAIGELCSSLTTHQVIAALTAMASLAVLFWLLSYVIAPPPWGDLVSYVWAYNHLNTFMQGRLTVQDVVFFITLIAGPLFLTTRVLESRRWR